MAGDNPHGLVPGGLPALADGLTGGSIKPGEGLVVEQEIGFVLAESELSHHQPDLLTVAEGKLAEFPAHIEFEFVGEAEGALASRGGNEGPEDGL